MKKLIYLILFIPVIGFGQTYPHQIEPDTTHRMIMMTDTSVIDSPAMEFLYFSIDSLVEQIARDTLGLDSSYWSLDATGLSLNPKYSSTNLSLMTGAGGSVTTGTDNVYIGANAGNANETGLYNVFLGSGAGQNNTGGNNMFIGQSAFKNSSSGSFNVGIGSQVAISNTGSNSLIMGYQAGSNSTGSRNIFLGYTTGRDNTGTNNTYVGYQAGRASSAGSSNVFLGYQAGFSETGSNKLYIENTLGSSPLIYGDFSTDEVTINNDLFVSSLNTSDYLYSTSDQILGGLWSGVNISEFNNDAGYITGEVDGSTTNEIQTLSLTGSTLSLTSGGSVTIAMYDGGAGYVRPASSSNGVWFPDGILDFDLDYGTSGQVLSSTGTNEVNWIDLTTSPWSTGAGDDIYYNTGVHHVGIGITNPTYELHVVGEARITGDISTAGDIVATSTGTSYVDSDSDAGSVGEILAHDGTGLDWWDKGIGIAWENTDNTSSSTYVTWPPNSNYDSQNSDGLVSLSAKTFTLNDDGWYRFTATGSNQSTGPCYLAFYTTSAVHEQYIGTSHDLGGTGTYTPASFAMHWVGSYASGTTVTLRAKTGSGVCIIDDLAVSVEQIKKN